jgi:uncharacterized membrane protein YgcG
MKRIFTALSFLLIGLSNLEASSLNSDERILSFRVDITIREDGKLEVEELIRVRAAGSLVKRGIFRDFPVSYLNKYGLVHKVNYDFVEVTNNQEPEDFSVKLLDENEGPTQYIRLYIGNEQRYLQAGTYYYKIRYVTNYQLFYDKEYVELYWNVTGNYWNIPIDKVTARIQFPDSAQLIHYKGFRGLEGNSDEYWFDLRKGKNHITFHCPSTFWPGEGMTLVLQFGKEAFQEYNVFWKMLTDNWLLIIALLGVVVVLFLYIRIWNEVGIDPPKGLVVPQFEIPNGYSPALIRYIHNMYFDNVAFTATMLNLAVTGYVNIDQRTKGTFVLSKLKEAGKEMCKHEKEVLGRLFGGRQPQIRIGDSPNERLMGTVHMMRSNLEKEAKGRYVNTNRRFMKIPLIVSVILTGLVLASLNAPQMFLTLWIIGWTFGCIALFRELLRLSGKTVGEKIIMLVFNVLFSGTWVGVLIGSYYLGVPTMAVFIVLALVFLNLLFTYLIQAPTQMGREVMDKIEGFKLYLTTAEQHTLRFATDEESLSHFERFLPYAVALDCETVWTRKFQHVIDRAMTGKAATSRPHFHTISSGSFSSGLSKGLTRAATTSGTRSSSGGGSSGGGRGSRGGGGW